MKAALQNYQDRMRRVLDHIDRHLDDDLDLHALSGVAAFSKFHFHRQFSAIFRLSVYRYVHDYDDSALDNGCRLFAKQHDYRRSATKAIANEIDWVPLRSNYPTSRIKPLRVLD